MNHFRSMDLKDFEKKLRWECELHHKLIFSAWALILMFWKISKTVFEDQPQLQTMKSWRNKTNLTLSKPMILWFRWAKISFIIFDFSSSEKSFWLMSFYIDGMRNWKKTAVNWRTIILIFIDHINAFDFRKNYGNDSDFVIFNNEHVTASRIKGRKTIQNCNSTCKISISQHVWRDWKIEKNTVFISRDRLIIVKNELKNIDER